MTSRFAVLLTPGASATKDHAGLLALDAGLTTVGHVVQRVDFAGKGRREIALIDFIREQTETLRVNSGLSVVIGGRSFGGRMCSLSVTAGLQVRGLLLLSYPLHPPAKRDMLRTEHFGAIKVPTLFVSGTSDAFGSPDDFSRAIKHIPAAVSVEWITGGNHGMHGKNDEVLRATKSWLQTL